MDAEPQLFRRLDADLVESIFWDERTGELAWVDIPAGTFTRARLDGPVDGSGDRVVQLPAPVSAVQPAVGGGYVAALEDRVVALDAEGAIVDTLGSVAHPHPGMRFNEAKVDPFGRFVVGSMNTASDEPDAAVHLFAPGRPPRLLRGGFTVTNGFEWSESGDEMYLTDTPAKTVYRASYGPDADPLGVLEPYLTGYTSDGLVRDETGGFWNAVFEEGTVVRWRADGSVASVLEVPVPHTTSVALGGPDRRTLFIGTSREGLTDEELAAAPLSGSIFRLDVADAGLPVGVYGAASAPERRTD